MSATKRSGRVTLVVVVGLIVGTAYIAESLDARGAAPAPANTTLCRARDDFSSRTRWWVIQVASDTDSVMTATRAAWGIAILDSTEIVFVQDSATCARGARAHALAAGQDTLSPPTVYLLRIGPTRYMGWNGVILHGSLIQYLFNSEFVLLETLGS